MKKNRVFCLAGCLALGLIGCATQESEKGYLTPDQTAPASQPSQPGGQQEMASASGAGEGPTSVGRLPPPSVTQPVTESEPAARQPETKPEPVSNESPPAEKSTEAKGAQITAKTTEEKAEPEEKDEPEEKAEAPREKPQVKTSPSFVSSNLGTGSTRLTSPNVKIHGYVVSINQGAKFVVLKFEYGAIPAVGKTLDVLRNGEKVGQIRITKPVKPPHASADVLDGVLRRGDQVQ